MALLGVELAAVACSRRSRLPARGRARCAIGPRRDHGPSRSRGVATGGKPRRARGDEASTWRPAATGRTGVAGRGRARPRGGAATWTGAEPPGGDLALRAPRPPSQRARWSLSRGLRATTRGGVAAGGVARLVATTARSGHPRTGRSPYRTTPGAQRACRLTNLAPDAAARRLVECGVSAEDAHVHDVLRHGRRARPPRRMGAQTE